jgi:P27 family predicted phage terminase small subunit
MRGRKPKPTSRQIADGDTRKLGAKKLQAKLDSEPKAAKGLPGCPAHLTGIARKVWKFWAEELAAMDLACRPDGVMLEGACVQYARAVAADVLVESEGMIASDYAIDKQGEPFVIRKKPHPAVGISERAWKLVRSFCSEFGLSPISRQRLAVKDNDAAADDLMNLLSRPRSRSNATIQ